MIYLWDMSIATEDDLLLKMLIGMCKSAWIIDDGKNGCDGVKLLEKMSF